MQNMVFFGEDCGGCDANLIQEWVFDIDCGRLKLRIRQQQWRLD